MAIKIMNAYLLIMLAASASASASVIVANSNFCKVPILDFDCGIQEDESKRCISSFWICDHIFDCKTGADEIGCKYLHDCRPGEFSCRDGDCISAAMRCDGKLDCLDGSDERACAKPSANDQQPEAIPNPRIENSDSISESQRDQQSIHHRAARKYAEYGALESSDKQNGNGSSGIIGFLLFSSLIIAAGVLIALYISRYHPLATSGLVHQMRGFGQGLSAAGGSVWSMVSGRFSSQEHNQSRVEIINGASIVPPQPQVNNDGKDQRQEQSYQNYFDNPMNTLQQPQPLVLSVPTQQQGSPYQHRVV